ncbi:MAG: hypothetical protein KatS3mg004_0666 [Bryobacteraceae bacterium]|nr:MAG: hypothetical protein KatS3mg004_0666 [Bryobacteraceae bacterium]
MTKTMKFLAIFLAVAVFSASAATYNVTLFQPSLVAGKELKPGDYKLIVEDGKAIIQKGKEKVEATVRVEQGDSKFSSTSVRYSEENGKLKIQEIRLGGTTTKLVFN